MSRIVISNDKTLFDEQVDFSIKSGLSLNCQEKRDGIYFAVFDRRVKHEVNFLVTDNSSIFYSGTVALGSNAVQNGLLEILDNFECVQNTQEEVVGNYSLAISNNNGVSVFCDKYSIYDLFYFTEGNKYLISNSLLDLSRSKCEAKVDQASLISETLLAGYIGNKTLFKGIYKLRGVEYIKLTRDSFEIVPLNYKCKKWDYSGETIEKAVKDYAKLIAKYSKIIQNSWDNIAIHQTGGLDNRLVFSALVSLGIKPYLLYGKGNSILTTTNKEDMDCVADYASRFGLNHRFMNWGHKPQRIEEKNWSNLFEKYGFKYAMYGASSSFFQEYEGNIDHYPDFFEFGYYGENLRLREYLDGRNSVSTTEFFNDYLFGGEGGYGNLNSIDFLPNSKQIKEELEQQFREEAKCYGLNIGETISKKEFDQIRWVHARKADSRSLNFVNEFAASLSILSIPELHEFPWSLPAEWRENGEFQIRVINELCEKSLEVPIFSHGKLQTINPVTLKLERKYSIAQKIKISLEHLGVNTKVIEKLANIYHTYLQKDREIVKSIEINKVTENEALKWVVDYLDHECRDELNYVNAKNYPGHIVGLYRYALHIYALDKLI